MNITINGNPADITLETEKNVGDVLAGLDGWLAGSGFRLSGLAIDGKAADSGSMETLFNRELADIQSLDIKTSSLGELTAEALLYTREDCEVYEQGSFETRQNLAAQWRQSPAALFLLTQCPEVHQWTEQAFSGEGIGAGELRGILDERLREFEDPLGELNRVEPLIEGLVRRLEDLPLDIQTGKDGRAAETIQIFSGISGKIFRLFNIQKERGLDTSALNVDNISIHAFIEEFGAALRELLAAYETKDTVLVGDLAEYELAPRLRKLYAVVKSPVVSPV
jgi:hypothetical protein